MSIVLEGAAYAMGVEQARVFEQSLGGGGSLEEDSQVGNGGHKNSESRNSKEGLLELCKGLRAE